MARYTATISSSLSPEAAFATVTGSTVTYDADLRLKGLLRLADPVLGLVFRRIGDRARDGLRAALSAIPDGVR